MDYPPELLNDEQLLARLKALIKAELCPNEDVLRQFELFYAQFSKEEAARVIAKAKIQIVPIPIPIEVELPIPLAVRTNPPDEKRSD